MTGDLFVLLSLGALLVFIVWEGWRNRRSAAARRAQADEGFTPGGASRELALYVLAAVCAACGLLAVYFPGAQAAGRSARIVSLIESLLGPNALPLVFLAGAVAAFVAAIAARRRRVAR
jgi:formate hydrogenlyase subunit 4